MLKNRPVLITIVSLAVIISGISTVIFLEESISISDGVEAENTKIVTQSEPIYGTAPLGEPRTGNVTISISHLPNIGETAVVTVTNNDPWLQMGKIGSEIDLNIELTSNLEFVDLEPTFTYHNGNAGYQTFADFAGKDSVFIPVTIRAVGEGNAMIKGYSGIDQGNTPANIQMVISENTRIGNDAPIRGQSSPPIDFDSIQTFTEEELSQIAEKGPDCVFRNSTDIQFENEESLPCVVITYPLTEEQLRYAEQLNHTNSEPSETIPQNYEESGQNSHRNLGVENTNISTIQYDYPLHGESSMHTEENAYAGILDFTISNLPKVGETAEIKMNYTQGSNILEYAEIEFSIDGSPAQFNRYITITDNFEFVNQDNVITYTSEFDNKVYHAIRNLIDPSNPDENISLSATIRAVSEGMGKIKGGGGPANSVDIKVHVGENETLLKEDYLNLHPEMRPQQSPPQEQIDPCPHNEPCPDLPPTPEEIAEDLARWPQPATTSISFPEQVNVGDEFIVEYSWSFAILDEDREGVIDEVIIVPEDYPGVYTGIGTHSGDILMVSDIPDVTHQLDSGAAFSKVFDHDGEFHTEQVIITYEYAPEPWENSLNIAIGDARYHVFVIPNDDGSVLTLTTDQLLQNQYAKERESVLKTLAEGGDDVGESGVNDSNWIPKFNPYKEIDDENLTSPPVEIVELHEVEWVMLADGIREASESDSTYIERIETSLRNVYTSESVDKFLEAYPEFRSNIETQSFEFSLFDYVLPKAYS